MTIFQILVLSLIQGLTEFLPVSSSGHLVLLPHLFGWQNQGLEMDVALHVGTLTAVLIYFWSDIWQMVTHFIRYCLSGFKKLPLMSKCNSLSALLLQHSLPLPLGSF